MSRRLGFLRRWAVYVREIRGEPTTREVHHFDEEADRRLREIAAAALATDRALNDLRRACQTASYTPRHLPR